MDISANLLYARRYLW